MSFGFNNQNEFKYYNCHGSNGYTYVDGIGFAPPPPEANERKLLRRFGNYVGTTMLLYLALSVVVPQLLLRIIVALIPTIRIFGSNIVAPAPTLFLIDMLSYMFVTIIPFIIYALLIKIPMKVCLPHKRLQKGIILSGILIGLGSSVIGSHASGILYQIFAIFGKVPTMPDFSPTSSLWSNIFLFSQTVLLAPILEEIVFRGIFMQSFRRFGDAFALIISSLLFAVAHGNFIQSPNAFIVGLVIGYFVLRCGSLRIGIIIHMVNNFLSFVSGLLLERLSDDAQFTILSAVQAFYVIAAIISILYLLRKYQNFFSLETSETPSTCKEKSIFFFSAGGMIIFLLVAAQILISSLSSY